MKVSIVWAIREQPDDENEDLYEFGLFYFRLIDATTPKEEMAVPAILVRFSDVSQIETLQFHCPFARLGPSHAFTEGLVLTKDLEEAGTLCKKLERIFMDAEMKEMLDDDVMEDY
jgi:hypothetical protein